MSNKNPLFAKFALVAQILVTTLPMGGCALGLKSNDSASDLKTSPLAEAQGYYKALTEGTTDNNNAYLAASLFETMRKNNISVEALDPKKPPEEIKENVQRSIEENIPLDIEFFAAKAKDAKRTAKEPICAVLRQTFESAATFGYKPNMLVALLPPTDALTTWDNIRMACPALATKDKIPRVAQNQSYAPGIV